MYHFFVSGNQIEDGKITILGQDVNHISHVLRLRQGEQVCVTDGKGTIYTCALREFLKDRIEADVLEQKPSEAELPVEITLYQGFPKSDKMEQIIQKSVELGAACIVPVMTERTIVKLDAGKARKKQERFIAIAQAAAKQSGRARIPEIGAVVSFREAVLAAETQEKQAGGAGQHLFIPYELAENMEETRRLFAAIRPGDRVFILIGPEGGFSHEEVEYAVSHGFKAVTLGKRILRTETAGPAVLAMLGYVVG